MKRKSPATEERLEAVRAHLREHHAGIEPDAGFAARVASRLRRRSAGEAFAWAALRLLPASLAVLAALAWISLQLVETRADAGDRPAVGRRGFSDSFTQRGSGELAAGGRERAMKGGAVWASVLSLFLVGVSIGALGMFVYLERTESTERPEGRRGGLERGPGPRHGGPPMGPPPFADPSMLADRLELRPDQLERLDEILRVSRDEVRAMRESWRPQIVEHLERTRLSIAQILDDDQRRRFDEMSEEAERHFERLLTGGGPRRPRRGPGRRGRRGGETP